MRWTPKRKRAVFDAIARADAKDVEKLKRQVGLSEEEFQRWAILVGRNGTLALRATHVQDYRRAA